MTSWLRAILAIAAAFVVWFAVATIIPLIIGAKMPAPRGVNAA